MADLLRIRPQNNSGVIQAQFYFGRRKDMKKTSLLKFVGALLLAAGTFFTPLTTVSRAGSPACRPDGVTCRPSDFIPCCGVCSKGICRPILE